MTRNRVRRFTSLRRHRPCLPAELAWWDNTKSPVQDPTAVARPRPSLADDIFALASKTAVD